MSELDFHPEPEQLEAYVEGTIEIAQRAVLESHLLGCARCSADVEEWRAFFVALDTLPPIEPSPGFIDRVMANVQVLPVPARARLRWLPQSTKSWGLVAAFLALPVIGFGALIAWVLAQPWATPSAAAGVLGYAWAGVSSAATWVTGEVTALVLQTPTFQAIADGVRQFLAAAGATGVGLAALTFCLAALGSAWILYHNLVRTSTRVSNYAPYTI